MFASKLKSLARSQGSRSALSQLRTKTDITVALGDGIGPEITNASLRILDAAGADLNARFIEVGEKKFLGGFSSGIEPSAWDVIRDTRVLFKGPITTPSGSGYKSLNVTMRKTLGLYANVRPCISYHPVISTKHPKLDVVIVRENEEDLYAGIEHRQTQHVMQCLKLISVPGTEKIIRYAFEYARQNGRKKVTLMVKDNIMKVTDGVYRKIFNQVKMEYPEITSEVQIIDIGTARLAAKPELYDVIVTLNLYGDIISDVAAELTGSVGLGSSANIGKSASMFEAIHGSAPDIAGKNMANPSGQLLSSVLMLKHLNKFDVASRIENAWLRTIEDGVHTPDIYREDKEGQKSTSRVLVGTKEFSDAVIANLGKKPERFLKAVDFSEAAAKAAAAPAGGPKEIQLSCYSAPPEKKELVGVDVFLHWNGSNAEELGEQISKLSDNTMKLVMITNRGVKVWPQGHPETFTVDHWRLRFKSTSGLPIKNQDVISILLKIDSAGFDFIKSEHLFNFDGQAGYQLGQGE